MSSKGIYTGPKVKDIQTFIQKAQFVHGNKFGYEKAVYVNSRSKITITCPIHGDFEQTPNNHLQGRGCSSCQYDSYRSNVDKFIEQAQIVHGGRYDYSKSEYTNNNTKITITCNIHGDFEQDPSSHLKGSGCCGCHFDSKRSNTEEFIEQAKLVHGDTYGYEKAEYIGAHFKVTLTCPIHGEFEQSPSKHLRGCGCPSCTYESNPGGYRDNKEEYKQQSAIFYHVRFTNKNTDEAFEKIGVTTNSISRRFDQITNDHNLKLEVVNEYHTTLYKAIEIEQEIKEYLNDNNLAYKVHTLKQYNLGGWTECFRCGDLDMMFNLWL